MYFQIFVSIIYNISKFKSIIGVSVINIRIPDLVLSFLTFTKCMKTWIINSSKSDTNQTHFGVLDFLIWICHFHFYFKLFQSRHKEPGDVSQQKSELQLVVEKAGFALYNKREPCVIFR